MRNAHLTVFSLLAAVAITVARPYARALIDPATLSKVRANAITISNRRYASFPILQPPLFLTYRRISGSWEIGTLTEALLEYSWPLLSVFSYNPLPFARQLYAYNYPTDVFNIAARCVPSTVIIRSSP